MQTLAEDANDSERASLKEIGGELSCIVAHSRMYPGMSCISSAHSALLVGQPVLLIVENQLTDNQKQGHRTV